MATLDLASLKAYVSGAPPRSMAAGMIVLDIEHSNIATRFKEIPFDVDMSVRQAKDKIYTLCGTAPQYQSLMHNGKAPLNDDARTLRDYGVNGGFLVVVDGDPNSVSRGGGVDDVSLVSKYVMSDEEYNKRENTYRAFRQKQLAADPQWRPVHAPKRSSRPPETESPEETRSRVYVGERCSVSPGDRRGVVSYIGEVPELTPITAAAPVSAVWIGVTLDEPLGKHDGAVNGKRYFQTQNKCAAFVRPSQCAVGDYPERDPFADDDDGGSKERSDDAAYEEL